MKLHYFRLHNYQAAKTHYIFKMAFWTASQTHLKKSIVSRGNFLLVIVFLAEWILTGSLEHKYF